VGAEKPPLFFFNLTKLERSAWLSSQHTVLRMWFISLGSVGFGF